MPSFEFQRGITAVETEEVFLTLLEISHDDMSETYYFVDNTVSILSNGVVYDPYPFRITLPEDKEGVLPQVKLTIDNVDRKLTEALRGYSNPPNAVVKIILASNPDQIEMMIDNLKLRNIRFDTFQIEGALIMDSPLGRKFPASTFNPKQYPALFYR